MKANELRIGNYVHCHRLDGSNDLKQIEHSDIFWAYNNEDFFNAVHDPIPLAEEILLRVDRIIKISEGEFRLGNLTIQLAKYETGDMITVFIGGELLNFHHYLHTFQNLYFDLTGEELQVNL